MLPVTLEASKADPVKPHGHINQSMTLSVYHACAGERKLKPTKPFPANVDITTGKLLLLLIMMIM